MNSRTIFGIWERGHTDAFAIKDDLLLSRISETVAWCKSVTELDGLRSEPLKPSLFHSGPDDLICQVGSSRSLALKWKKIEAAACNLVGGRLMVYFPDADLCDGAAEAESDGFFDVFNTPPFDTWVSFFDDGPSAPAGYSRYALCYIPHQFCALADGGISVNPEDCIQWLDNADVRVRSRLSSLFTSHSN